MRPQTAYRGGYVRLARSSRPNGQELVGRFVVNLNPEKQELRLNKEIIMKISLSKMLKITVMALIVPGMGLSADHKWDIDSAHTTAQFSVKHLMVSNVKGFLGPVTGSITYDPKNVGATSVEISIDASQIDTKNEKRDKHLKSDAFFDVENHKTVTFKSTRAKAAGKGKLKVWGNLTIKGVTKEVVLEIKDIVGPIKGPFGGPAVIGAVATAEIDREDFGLTWNMALEAGGILVGKTVKITLDIGLKKAE